MRREGRARGAGKDSGAQRRRARSEINGRSLARKKRTKKLNMDISARRGQKAKRAGLAGIGGESSFRSKICSNC